MPSIDVAMEMSVRRGVLETLVNGLRPAIENRGVVADAQTQISDVTTAFSSWDNCMAVTYCKWPVIAVIIVGGLIIFSIVWCIARCLCCGLSCCCSCCQCLKCCGNCCGCCDTPRSKAKYLDEPYIPPNQGYRSEAPMSAGAIRPAVQSSYGAPKTVEPPQYAVFDDSKKHAGNEDSLPAMPSWQGAEQDKVALEEEDAVEMKNMKKMEAGLEVPLMNGQPRTPSPGGVSAVGQNRGPYGPPGSPAAASGYFAAVPGGAPAGSPYGTPGQGYDQGYSQGTNGYGRLQTSFGTDQNYGMAGGAMGQGQSRSPVGYPQQGFTQSPGGFGGVQSPQQGSHEYGQSGSMASGINQPNQPYGQRPAAALGAVGGTAYPDRSRGSPAPQQGYGQQNTMSPGGMNQPYGASNQRAPPAGPSAMAGAAYPDRSHGSPAPGAMGGAAYPDRSRGSPAPPQAYGQRGNYADRSYSPAPVHPPQRQLSQDAARQAPGLPQAPNRQYSGDSNPRLQRAYTGDAPPQPQRSYTGDVPPQAQRSYTGNPGSQPQRSYTSDSSRPMPGRQPPRRQYSSDVVPGSASPSLENSGGFDFTSGYSRPPTYNSYSGRPVENQQQQQQQQSGAAAYPGHKPYQPSGNAQQQNAWNGQR